MPICPNQGHAMDPTSIPQISDVCHSPQTGKGGFITPSVDFSDEQSSLVSATVRQSEIVLSKCIFKPCLNSMKIWGKQYFDRKEKCCNYQDLEESERWRVVVCRAATCVRLLKTSVVLSK